MESTSKPQGSNPEGSPEAYAGLNPGLEGSSSAVRPAVDGRSGGNGEGGDSPGKGCSLSFPALQRLTSVFIRGMQLALCCASFSVMVSADEVSSRTKSTVLDCLLQNSIVIILHATGAEMRFLLGYGISR